MNNTHKKFVILDTEIVFDICVTKLSRTTSSSYNYSFTNATLSEMQSDAYRDASSPIKNPLSVGEIFDVLNPEILKVGFENQKSFIKELDEKNISINRRIRIKKFANNEYSFDKITKDVASFVREDKYFILNNEGVGNIEMSGADFDFCNGCIVYNEKLDYFILLDNEIRSFFEYYYPELISQKVRTTYFLIFDLIEKTNNFRLLDNIDFVLGRRIKKIHQQGYRLTARNHFSTIFHGFEALVNSISMGAFLKNRKDPLKELKSLDTLIGKIKKGIGLAECLPSIRTDSEYKTSIAEIERLLKDCKDNLLEIGVKYGRK